MDEEDKETRLIKRKEAQRNKLKLKHEKQKYHSIILKATQEQFFESHKISFWDGDKDSGKWQNGVIQCSPICKIVPYGENSTLKNNLVDC
jgi:hypothetical protein